MTTLSIALATFNGARFLRQQLDSLVRQTRRPDELVVCDDMSNDDTVAILRDFAQTAPFPVHIHINPSRLNYRQNFMNAANLCRSDLIAFCDQDDIWDPEKLAIVCATMERTGCLLAQHGFRMIDGAGQPITGGLEDTSISNKDIWSGVLGLTQVFRRELLDHTHLWPLSVDHNKPSERMAHDQWVYFLALSLGEVEIIPTPLLSYRQHGANTYGLKREEKLPLAKRIFKDILVVFDRIRGQENEFSEKHSVILKMLERGNIACSSRLQILGILSRLHGNEGVLKWIGVHEKFKADFLARIPIYTENDTIIRMKMFTIAYIGQRYKFDGMRWIRDSFLDFTFGIFQPEKCLPNASSLPNG